MTRIQKINILKSIINGESCIEDLTEIVDYSKLTGLELCELSDLLAEYGENQENWPTIYWEKFDKIFEELKTRGPLTDEERKLPAGWRHKDLPQHNNRANEN